MPAILPSDAYFQRISGQLNTTSNTVVRDHAYARLQDAMAQGYPAVKLDADLVPYVRARANAGDSTAVWIMQTYEDHLFERMNWGWEMDPALVELADYENSEAKIYSLALKNANALGRPLQDAILQAYIDLVPEDKQVPPILDLVRESLEKVIASKGPLQGLIGGEPIDHTPALDLLLQRDRAAGVAVLQDILRQNLALNLPLDPMAMGKLTLWDNASALAIAQEKLLKDISRNVPLDAASFSLVEGADAAAGAAVLEQKIRDAITRGAADSTVIISGAPNVMLLAAIDRLEALGAGAKQRMAVLYLEGKIARDGPLVSLSHDLLYYLKTTNLNAYAGVLVKSIRASNARPEFTAHFDELKSVNPAAAATLMQEYLQLNLARTGKVDVGGAPAFDVLNRLAALDKRAAEQFAKAALADALSRGVKISTGLAVPLPTAPATDTGNFTLTLQALNNWNPAAAAEWAISFDLLASNPPTPMADIKAAFTPDQSASLQSWTTVMQKLLGDPGIVDDTVITQVNLDVDLETALQLVFLGRAQQLEKQLRDQIASVQAKNDQMGRMNDALGTLNKVQELVLSDAKATDEIGKKSDGKITAALITEVNNALKAAGVTPFTGGFTDKLTKGELAGAIQQMKAQIDSLGNNQQTEMIRLQSLTTKRNECYEIITNQMSKMSSINEKIMGNMR